MLKVGTGIVEKCCIVLWPQVPEGIRPESAHNSCSRLTCECIPSLGGNFKQQEISLSNCFKLFFFLKKLSTTTLHIGNFSKEVKEEVSTIANTMPFREVT